MLKSFKKMFVSIFILMFSSTCIVNLTSFASFSCDPIEEYNGCYLDHESSIDKVSFAKNAYDNLFDLYRQILLNPGMISPNIFSPLKSQYTLVCKNLVYLIDSEEKYYELHQNLNYITTLLFGRSLNEPLVLSASEEYQAMTLSGISIIQILQSRLSLFKKNLDLFDAMFAYSCIPEDAPTTAKTYLGIIFVLNKIDPETLLFYEE